MNTQTRARVTPAAAALAATLGVAAVAWAVAVRQMSGMDMGPGTGLGSVAFFAALWVPMMAAMMLPGAAPAAIRAAQDGGARAVPALVGPYLAVWALAGVAVYLLYRPHGTVAAGLAVIVAGGYELTPVKAHFRRLSQDGNPSGWRFGFCCLGSSAGLMLILLALGAMSTGWMAVLTVAAAGQKLLPPRPAADVPLALAIVALGAAIIVAPSAVPGLTLPALPM